MKSQESKDYAVHKLILGTHTSGSEQNYLMVANVNLPMAGVDIDNRTYDDEKGEMGGFGGVHGKASFTPYCFSRNPDPVVGSSKVENILVLSVQQTRFILHTFLEYVAERWGFTRL